MKYITDEPHPILCWCNEPEESAIEQARNLARLPFLFRHVVLCSDCHGGYGMPIGGVIATKDAIICNAVGVDIGCGVTAVKTNIRPEEITTDQIKEIMGEIRKHVPFGFNHHKEDKYVNFSPYHTEIVKEQLNSAKKQIGTLGGGNHFIEIQKGSDGYIWYMIHSGSRNVGLKVAQYYNHKAIELNEKWFTCVDPKWDLAFLPIDEDLATDYI